MHIAIDGLDGAGKTMAARRVADELGFTFVHKPLHLVTDEGDSTENFRETLRRLSCIRDNTFRAMFLGCANYYLSTLTKKNGIVTDRYLASNYYQHYSEETGGFFDFLVESCGKPELTVILYASAEERRRRIVERDPNDKDLKRAVFDDALYEKMLAFVKRYQMPYLFLDTTYMLPEVVVQKILETFRQTISEGKI